MCSIGFHNGQRVVKPERIRKGKPETCLGLPLAVGRGRRRPVNPESSLLGLVLLFDVVDLIEQLGKLLLQGFQPILILGAQGLRSSLEQA